MESGRRPAMAVVEGASDLQSENWFLPQLPAGLTIWQTSA